MPKAVKKELAPTQPQAVITIAEGIPAEFGDPLARLPIATSLLAFAEQAAKAVESAQLLVVKDQSSYDNATDIGKSIQRVMKAVEDTRKEYTNPLDKAKKRLTELFAGPGGLMQDSLDAIRRKMSVWKQGEEARLRAAAEAQRKAEAEEAARLAAAAKAMGDKEGAKQIAADAAARAAAPIEVKVTGSGAFGGKTVDVKRPVGRVTDKMAFLQWALSTAMAGPGSARSIIEGAEFGKLGLNVLAKELLAMPEPVTIPGFVYEYDTNTNFR